MHAEIERAEHDDCLYCPGCKVGQGRQVRWYSRSAWLDPRQVLCAAHGLPLLRWNEQSKTMRACRTSRALRQRFAQMNRWLSVWIHTSPCLPEGRLGFSRTCLEDAILGVLTRDGRHGAPSRAVSLGQWRLWTEDWPTSPRPRGLSSFQLRNMARQVDLLALVGTVWRVCAVLTGNESATWPPLPISERLHFALQRHLQQSWPGLLPRVQQVFTY